MLKYNTMRFGTDVFTVSPSDTPDTQSGGDSPSIGYRQALLISGDALDTSAASAVNHFIVGGVGGQNTRRRLMFKIDNKVYRFIDGQLSEYTKTITAENVWEDGNTVSEITELNDIPALVGKRIYPIIALRGLDNTPTITLALNISKTTGTTKTYTATSAQYSLPRPGNSTPKIISISADSTCTGSGSVSVSVRRKIASNTWTAYESLEAAANQPALDVQFKIVYSVVNVGSDSAKLNSIVVNYIANAEAVAGTAAELFSVIPNFETDLRLCYLVVRHKNLIDSVIQAYANFFPTPKHRERIQIGKGIADYAVYTLGVNGVPDKQIDHSSIRIYVNGVQTSDFDYNTETSEIKLKTYTGRPITASYDYDCGLEEWHPMIKEFDQQPYLDGTYMTRFSYVLPDDSPATLANIRISLIRPEGTVINQSLGKATGRPQQIVLPHVAKTDSISLNADFTYDFDNRILTFTAPKDTDLVLSYDWYGEKHKIYSWAAGWAAA